MRIAALAGLERREEIGNKKVTEVFFDFEFEMTAERIDLLASLSGTVFVNSVAPTLASIKKPFVRFNAWPGFFGGQLLEVSTISETKKNEAEKIFHELGWDYQWVPDIAGMISPRIVAMIINEAYYTFGDKISTKEEIDIAMKLGTNYPQGPFEWSRKIGLKNIYELLSALNNTDKSYDISRALLGELENQA